MNFSFLKSKKRKPIHSAALSKSLAEMIDLLRKERADDSWLSDFCAFGDRARALNGAPSPLAWNQLAKDIVSIYGMMGSFNDNMYPQHLRESQGVLYNSAVDTIRETRRELGGSWVSVSEQEVFRVGQRVTLIKGETIALQRDGEPMRAPDSPIVYTILGRQPNDIDNTPMYHIQSDSHVRNARHGALRSVGAP